MTKKNNYCLPIRRLDDRFVPDLELTSSWTDLPLYQDLKDYFEEDFRRLEAPVEIDGVTYNACVFEPKYGDDVSYALVDIEGLPAARPLLKRRSWKIVKKYLSRFWDKLAFSEQFPFNNRSYLMTEFVAPTFRMVRGSELTTQRQLSWKEVRSYARLIITGPAGIGKTTCLRMLALEETNKRDDERSVRLPVYLQLRELTREIDLMSVAGTRVFGEHQHDDIWIEVINSGRLLLLLDGIDELDLSGRVWLIEQIENLAAQYPSVGLLLTSRDAVYEWKLSGFTHLRIEPFDVACQQEWITKRVGRLGNNIAKELLTLILSNTGLDAVTGNPLLLAIAAAYVERVGCAPTSSSSLILKYIEALIDDWDASRGVKRWTSLSLPKEKMLEILCRIAFRVVEENCSSFLRDEFLKWEAPWLNRNESLNALETIWHHSGLLVPTTPGEDSWRFSHIAFEEVLAAKYLVERTDDLFPKLANIADWDRMSAIWTYACSMTSDATPLIDFMLKRHQGSELIRAAFIARAILECITMPRDMVSQSCDFVISAVRCVAERLTVEKTEGDEGRWMMKFKWAARSQLSVAELRGFCNLVRTLTTGIITDRRRDLAQLLKKLGNDVAMVVGNRMETGGKAEARLDIKSRQIVFEGMIVHTSE